MDQKYSTPNIPRNDINDISSKSTHRTPLVRQLRLFIDQTGLICCGGRIHNAPIGDSANFPLLLPPKNILTDLKIRATHNRQLHAGVNSTLTALRQRYWIPTGRQQVKKLVRKCVICRKIVGPAFNTPDPLPLPRARLQQTRPFTITGVDYIGALYVREAGTENKVYIAMSFHMCHNKSGTP